MFDKTNRRFGRKVPAVTTFKAHFGAYALSLPTPPASIDYSFKASTPLSSVYLNDKLRDCVIAGFYHYLGMAQANAGIPVLVPSSAQLIHDYSAISGYNPANPDTDQGCDEVTALNFWKKTGAVNGDKIIGWFPVDATNKLHVQLAIWLFESAYFGISLPTAWVNPFPQGSGFVWGDGAPNRCNGHCVVATGYDAVGVQIDTWGHAWYNHVGSCRAPSGICGRRAALRHPHAGHTR